LRCIDWDLVAWLPSEPGVVRGDRRLNGLDQSTWAATFHCQLFKELIAAIVKSPADIIMSSLKCWASNGFEAVGSLSVLSVCVTSFAPLVKLGMLVDG